MTMTDNYKKVFKYFYKKKKELKINKSLNHKNILNYKCFEIIDK